MNDDIQFLIECLAVELTQLLMEKYNWDLLRAVDELYSSKTFELLNDPETGLYYESAVYVFTFLSNEIEIGKVA